MKQANQKRCENCRHFLQHYTNVNLRFREVHCGHCLERKLTPKEVRNFPFFNGCELWEPREIELQKRREYTEMILVDIHDRLDEIAEALKAK